MEPEGDEGWFTDPYGLHEARWMSMGRPTKLVRDGEVESYEEPPDSPPSHPAIAIEPAPGSASPADTLRADGCDPDVMPTIAEIDNAETSFAESRWRGPLVRSRRDARYKSDSRRFFP